VDERDRYEWGRWVWMKDIMGRVLMKDMYDRDECGYKENECGQKIWVWMKLKVMSMDKGDCERAKCEKIYNCEW